MPARRSLAGPIVAAFVAAVIVVISIPQNIRAGVPGIGKYLGGPGYHFGLDLKGGTELDFRISEDEIDGQIRGIDDEIAQLEEQGDTGTRIAQLRLERQVLQDQKANLVEAIRQVLERRINALGVSEATITPSYVGDERHFLVQCPDVLDVQKCVDTVGKTIQLEFKEQQTEADADFEKGVRAQADWALRAVTQSGKTLDAVGADLDDELGVEYGAEQAYFRDQLPKGLESIWTNPPATPVLREGTVTVPTQNADGSADTQDVRGIFIVQSTRAKTSTGRVLNSAPEAFKQLATDNKGYTYTTHEIVPLDASVDARVSAALRSMKGGDLKAVDMGDGNARLLFLRILTPGQEEMTASHILVQYKGANGADATVTRSKEEALTRANELKKRLNEGADFTALARSDSDGPSKQNGGSLGTITRESLVPEFAQIAFALPQGGVSDVVATPFGYHIIRSDKAPAMVSDQAGYEELQIPGPNALDTANTLIARLQGGQVTRPEDAIYLRTLFFSLMPTGWKDTPLDGKHFRSASVIQDQTTNFPMVQIVFDAEGGQLFQELTKRNVGKPIAIFVGGELVSAPTVQQEISGGTAVITGSGNFEEARLLAQDLNTGAIPAPIHLAGQRTVEATLGAEALSTSVQAAIFGMILLILYLVLVYRLFGVLAGMALIAYAMIFLAILQLPLFLVTQQYIVLTLAGLAGMILSIGLSVDTNVLIFERVKEELRKGKWLTTAVETGFSKAWPSIRDSNVSTLITCAILFVFGTSIVRGFAVTLAMGVVVSMLTGIVITRWLARMAAKTPLAKKAWLFPGMREEDVQH